ncbi:MAG: hypothetical protein Ct9H300mP19_09110 [Dehalococcoidia bacterium]|nr:MAG: hypothetical protein Ct9H300mP19_09110 [Dehalococcoidia bacterium]
METDEAGEHDLRLVRKDVAAAGGADDISFVPGTPTSIGVTGPRKTVGRLDLK